METTLEKYQICGMGINVHFSFIFFFSLRDLSLPLFSLLGLESSFAVNHVCLIEIIVKLHFNIAFNAQY